MRRIKKIIGFLIYKTLGNFLPGYKLGAIGKLGFLVRRLSAKLLFVKCGKKVNIGRKVEFSSNITLGNYSGIGDECHFQGEVIIGNDVMMGPRCAFIAQNHVHCDVDVLLRQQGTEEKKIVIGDNVWLGYGVIVLAGVQIGNNSIVGAGAVVSRDVPPDSIAVGSPAKVVKKRTRI